MTLDRCCFVNLFALFSLVMPPGFVERGIHHKIYRMEVRRGDIWIVTYPKCGTTWTSVRRVIVKSL